MALQLRQFVDAYHEGRDAGVVGEHLDVLADLLDELVYRLHHLLRRHVVVAWSRHQVPELLEEAVAAVNACYVPRLRLLDGAEEHLVETQRVGTVVVADVVGVHDVVLRLRHLFDGLTDDVFAFLVRDEFSLLEVGHPLANLLDVQFLAVDGADVRIDGVSLRAVVEVAVLLGIVVVLRLQQVVADILISTLDAEDKARPSLNHTLVHQLLERLVLAAVAAVKEELVPEA